LGIEIGGPRRAEGNTCRLGGTAWSVDSFDRQDWLAAEREDHQGEEQNNTHVHVLLPSKEHSPPGKTGNIPNVPAQTS